MRFVLALSKLFQSTKVRIGVPLFALFAGAGHMTDAFSYGSWLATNWAWVVGLSRSPYFPWAFMICTLGLIFSGIRDVVKAESAATDRVSESAQHVLSVQSGAAKELSALIDDRLRYTRLQAAMIVAEKRLSAMGLARNNAQKAATDFSTLVEAANAGELKMEHRSALLHRVEMARSNFSDVARGVLPDPAWQAALDGVQISLPAIIQPTMKMGGPETAIRFECESNSAFIKHLEESALASRSLAETLGRIIEIKSADLIKAAGEFDTEVGRVANG